MTSWLKKKFQIGHNIYMIKFSHFQIFHSFPVLSSLPSCMFKETFIYITKTVISLQQGTIYIYFSCSHFSPLKILTFLFLEQKNIDVKIYKLHRKRTFICNSEFQTHRKQRKDPSLSTQNCP